jgi:hypothetical protein
VRKITKKCVWVNFLGHALYKGPNKFSKFSKHGVYGYQKTQNSIEFKNVNLYKWQNAPQKSYSRKTNFSYTGSAISPCSHAYSGSSAAAGACLKIPGTLA